MFPLPTVRMSTRFSSRVSQYPNGMLPARYPAAMRSAVVKPGGSYPGFSSSIVCRRPRVAVLLPAARHLSGIWYFDTQSLIAVQSRLFRKASM